MKNINESVKGYKGIKVPYTLFGKSDNSKDLAILLPGFGYTVNNPAFHYSKGVLFQNAIDILEVNYKYNSELYANFSRDELDEAIKHDVRLVIDTVLNNNTYENYYFIAKSLGTIALSSELKRDIFTNAKAVWLTPVLDEEEVFKSMINNHNKGLCFIGDNDHFYTEERLRDIKTNKNITTSVIPGINHGLHYDDDVISSIDVLKRIITDIDGFITS